MDIKKFLPFVIGLLLALAASYFISIYLQGKEKEIIEQARRSVSSYQQNQVQVFVAAKDIAYGTPITPDLVDKALVSKNQTHPRAVQYFSDIMNKEAAGNIPSGSQITFDMVKANQIPIETKNNEDVSGPSLIIPSGKRAVTLHAENIDALNAMIKPGDKVDLITIMPIPERKDILNVTLLQNVLVLGVGAEYIDQQPLKPQVTGIKKLLPASAEKKQVNRGAAPVITLALTPDEASIIYYVQERAKIKLVLRSPGDTDRIEVPSIDTEMFYRFLASRGIGMVPPAVKEQEQEAQKKAVQKKEDVKIPIYRGIKKDSITVGNQ